MGAEGLTAGQVVDIKSENKEVGLETLEVRSGWWERVMQELGGGGANGLWFEGVQVMHVVRTRRPRR